MSRCWKHSGMVMKNHSRLIQVDSKWQVALLLKKLMARHAYLTLFGGSLQILITRWCGSTFIQMSASTTVWNAGVLLSKLQRYHSSYPLFSLHVPDRHKRENGIKLPGADEAKEALHQAMEGIEKKWPKQLWPGKTCEGPCECCSRHGTLIPIPKTFELLEIQPEQGRSTWSLIHWSVFLCGWWRTTMLCTRLSSSKDIVDWFVDSYQQKQRNFLPDYKE